MIRLIGTVTTIFGSTLNPFVSSSKNLKRPALDAGNAAFVFLSWVALCASFQLPFVQIALKRLGAQT